MMLRASGRTVLVSSRKSICNVGFLFSVFTAMRDGYPVIIVTVLLFWIH